MWCATEFMNEPSGIFQKLMPEGHVRFLRISDSFPPPSNENVPRKTHWFHTVFFRMSHLNFAFQTLHPSLPYPPAPRPVLPPLPQASGAFGRYFWKIRYGITKLRRRAVVHTQLLHLDSRSTRFFFIFSRTLLCIQGIRYVTSACFKLIFTLYVDYYET